MRRLNLTGLLAALTAGTVVLVAGAQDFGNRAPYWPAIRNTPPVVKEWYSDIPWHQKLGTYAGNEIDQALVMPYGALDQATKDFCTGKGYSEEKCMVELGINNILGMLRTDTLYDPQAPKILAADECKKGQPCIEVRLDVSNFYSGIANSDIKIVPRVFGKEPPNAAQEYGGYVITDGSTYGPQMPWYMSHYCDAFGTLAKDVQDPVCYGDYFSPMNAGFNAVGLGLTDWPRSVAWSVFPNAKPPSPGNHCLAGLTTCTIVLAGFNLTDLRQNLGNNPQFQYQKYNQFLFTWFNNALQGFATDFSLAQRQHHFPWNGAPVSWETFLYPQGFQNPFLGEYDSANFGEKAFAAGCDVTLTGPVPNVDPCNNTDVLRAKAYVYPRQCALADLAAGNAAKLRNCGLNYELHHNGWNDQWPKSYRDPSWMNGNQYGRTSFLFAGVPGMQMPVSLYKDPTSTSDLTIYEQVHNASLFSLYLPIANEADTKRAFFGRQYTDMEFYHTLLMSNHMESDPTEFAEGIRGKTLWHNEYRTQKMYESFKNGSSNFPTKMFAAAFAETAPAPFHNNTCDGCHVRNGSGVPINTANTLDPLMTKEFMNAGPYNPYLVKDYTFTGKIRPMKLVFFDLNRSSPRGDSSVFSEPLAFAPALIEHPPRTVRSDDLYYGSMIMNFYGDSFHVTRPGYNYAWNYETANPNRMVVNVPRFNSELAKTYTPWQVKLGTFVTDPSCQLVLPSPTTKPWPSKCDDINDAAIHAAIDGGTVGFMHLNGKRLGNLSAIEAIPNQAILGFRASQVATLGETIAGEIIWNAGSRDGVDGKVHRTCRTKSLADCYIARFGWIGDRVSLEDQVANAAFVEMNMTTTQGYKQLYPFDKVTFPIRYAYPNCGPADRVCVLSKGNADLTELDVNRMADYARWLGNPTRSEFQVSLPDVIAGEKIFRQVKCDTCHVIKKISIVPEDTMLSQFFRDRLATHVSGSASPFLSYLGTDLLMHDMGYLSQVGNPNPNQSIRDSDGVVLPKYQNYVQKIRTPPLKGLRFNRFVTESHKNTKTAQDPACDFLLHDGRACDAIEAAFLHDGPAIKKLGVIEGLSGLGQNQLLQLRAFLYSL